MFASTQLSSVTSCETNISAGSEISKLETNTQSFESETLIVYVPPDKLSEMLVSESIKPLLVVEVYE